MFKFNAANALACAFVGTIVVPALGQQIQFAVQYTDGAGEGFNDPVLGTARKDAFTFALNQWSSVLEASFVGETINVSASFNPVGGTPTSATLASAGPASFYNLNLTASGIWAPSALTNHLLLSQVDSDPEIVATFNTDVDGAVVLGNTDFYYGTDKNAGSDVDFVSTAMHEIGHGLGFNSALRSTTGEYDLIGAGSFADPTIYDFFLANAAGTQLVNMTPAQRMSAITSNSLFWAGEDGTTANGGFFPKIFAPSTFIQGSSVSHLDETVHQFDLMSPNYSSPDHLVSAIDRGMLSDMLWDVTPIPEPATMSLLLVSATTLFSRRQRRIAA